MRPRSGTTTSPLAGFGIEAGRESVIRLRDGRALSYGQWGAAGDPVVLGFHGGGLSRLQHYGIDAPTAAGVHLVLPDRPGYGRSDPHQGSTLLDWADDVRELADHLAAGRFGVFGVSAGGPFALACGFRLPERVAAVGLVSAVGGCYTEEPELASLLRSDARELVELAVRDPEAAAAEAARQCAEEAALLATRPETLLDGWPPATPDTDRELMADPAIRARFLAAFRETGSRGPAGLLLDTLLTYVRPWGFRAADVLVPVHIWHGHRDPFVSVDVARAMAAAIPGARLTEYPGEGHAVGYRHIAEILATLAPRPVAA